MLSSSGPSLGRFSKIAHEEQTRNDLEHRVALFSASDLGKVSGLRCLEGMGKPSEMATTHESCVVSTIVECTARHNTSMKCRKMSAKLSRAKSRGPPPQSQSHHQYGRSGRQACLVQMSLRTCVERVQFISLKCRCCEGTVAAVMARLVQHAAEVRHRQWWPSGEDTSPSSLPVVTCQLRCCT